MRRAILRLALCAIACSGVAARAEQHPDPAPIDPLDGIPILERSTLLEAVLARNPSLEEARQAWIAAAEGIPLASSLDSPMVSYSVAPLSIRSSEARFGEILRLALRIPYPGTLRLREEAATATAVAAERRIEEIRLHLITVASLLYDDYWLTERALSIMRAHLDLLESLRRVATSRYATGMAPQQAPIQAEVEAAQLFHRQVVLRTQRRKLVAHLNALLHRVADAPLPPPPHELDIDPSAIESVEVGAPSRPEVAELRAEVEALRAQVALKELGKKPDLEVATSFNSMWRTSEHQWVVGVGVRLPVWRRRLQASVAEAKARLAAGESKLAALSDTVAAEVEVALASVEEAAHLVSLHRNRVLPASRDQLAAARAGFETGEGSMLGLIDAERSLLAAELSHEEAIARASSARVELDRALGRLPLALVTSPSAADSIDSPQGNRP